MRKVPLKKIPVLMPPVKGTGRGKIKSAPHIRMVRRQTNEQILREFLNVRGFTRIRIQPSIHSVNYNYYGWHGVALTFEAESLEKMQEFVQAARIALVAKAKEMGLTVREGREL